MMKEKLNNLAGGFRLSKLINLILVATLLMNSSNTLFAQKWEKINSLTFFNERLFAVGKSTGYVFSSSVNQDLLLVSTDGGSTWKEDTVENFPPGTIENFTVTSSGRVFLIMRVRMHPVSYIYQYYSDDLKNWTLLSLTLGSGAKLYAFDNNVVGYLPSYGTAGMSYDGGLTWGFLEYTFTDIAESSDSSLYAIGPHPAPELNHPVIFKKEKNDDNFMVWNPENLGNHIKYIAVTNNGNILVAGNGGSSYLSKNGGGFDTIDSSFSAVYYAGGNTIIGVGQSSSSISKDGGETWTKINQGDLSNGTVKMVYYSNLGDIYAIGDASLFKYSDTPVITPPSDTTSNGNPPTKLSGSSMVNSLSIYPNPATNYFSVNGGVNLENIRVEVFNINGIKVLSAERRAQINISNLPNGYYFIRVSAKNVETYRTVLQIVR